MSGDNASGEKTKGFQQQGEGNAGGDGKSGKGSDQGGKGSDGTQKSGDNSGDSGSSKKNDPDARSQRGSLSHGPGSDSSKNSKGGPEDPGGQNNSDRGTKHEGSDAWSDGAPLPAGKPPQGDQTGPRLDQPKPQHDQQQKPPHGDQLKPQHEQQQKPPQSDQLRPQHDQQPQQPPPDQSINPDYGTKHEAGTWTDGAPLPAGKPPQGEHTRPRLYQPQSQHDQQPPRDQSSDPDYGTKHEAGTWTDGTPLPARQSTQEHPKPAEQPSRPEQAKPAGQREVHPAARSVRGDLSSDPDGDRGPSKVSPDATSRQDRPDLSKGENSTQGEQTKRPPEQAKPQEQGKPADPAKAAGSDRLKQSSPDGSSNPDYGTKHEAGTWSDGAPLPTKESPQEPPRPAEPPKLHDGVADRKRGAEPGDSNRGDGRSNAKEPGVDEKRPELRPASKTDGSLADRWSAPRVDDLQPPIGYSPRLQFVPDLKIDPIHPPVPDPIPPSELEVDNRPNDQTQPQGDQAKSPPAEAPNPPELGTLTKLAWLARIAFALATNQSPEQFGGGMVDKAKSLTIDPVMTISDMLDKARQKALDLAQGVKRPEGYVTPEEHINQLRAIAYLAGALAPIPSGPLGEIIGRSLVAPEGVVIPGAVVAIDGSALRAGTSALSVGVQAGASHGHDQGGEPKAPDASKDAGAASDNEVREILRKADEAFETSKPGLETAVELDAAETAAVRKAIGAESKWTTKEIGQAAERYAADRLKKDGHEVLGSIQNTRNNGIDLVTRKNGEYYVWEVKGNTSKMTEIQRRGSEFVATRTHDAARGGKGFDASARALARQLDQALKGNRVTYGSFRVVFSP